MALNCTISFFTKMWLLRQVTQKMIFRKQFVKWIMETAITIRLVILHECTVKTYLNFQTQKSNFHALLIAFSLEWAFVLPKANVRYFFSYGFLCCLFFNEKWIFLGKPYKHVYDKSMWVRNRVILMTIIKMYCQILLMFLWYWLGI